MDDIGSLGTRESRPLQVTRKIKVRGAVDIEFRRSDTPRCVVAGADADTVAAIKTYYQGDTLVIERVAMGIHRHGHGAAHVSGMKQVFYGPVHQVADSIVIVNGRQVTHINGQTGAAEVSGPAVVEIALPEMPRLSIQGSSGVRLVDLRQRELDVRIAGSGDIEASGRVNLLMVAIAGAGSVDTSELSADEARLTLAGSGNITALVHADVSAEVAGVGDIVIHGNPASRDTQIAGIGRIRFK